MSEASCRKFRELYNVSTLRQLASLPPPGLQGAIIKVLSNDRQRQEFTKVFSALPRLRNVTVSVKRRRTDGSSDVIPHSSTGELEFSAKAKEDLEVEVVAVKESTTSGDSRVYCPRYHKSKTLSWWLVLGCTDGELVAFKKIGGLGKQTSRHSLLFSAPDESRNESSTGFIVFLIADSVYGIEVFERFTIRISSDC